MEFCTRKAERDDLICINANVETIPMIVMTMTNSAMPIPRSCCHLFRFIGFNYVSKRLVFHIKAPGRWRELEGVVKQARGFFCDWTHLLTSRVHTGNDNETEIALHERVLPFFVVNRSRDKNEK